MGDGERNDWQRLKDQLVTAGVLGSDDLGRFVNNTTYFPASTFDERAAMPVLVAALPKITDPTLVGAIAGHLNRAWAKPAVYDSVYSAFLKWAPIDRFAGWALGDTLATVGRIENVDQFIQLVGEKKFGISRQMVVMSLWRYRGDQRIEQVLRGLLTDPDVCLHAMSALGRTVGPAALVSDLDDVIASDAPDSVRTIALRERRKLQKRLAKTSS